jgi:hypothetical protein
MERARSRGILSALSATLPQAHGFLDSSGVFSSIDVPGANGTYSYGVNNSGQIVGFFTELVGSQQFYHGYVDTNGLFTTIDVPGGTYTVATGVNCAGQIVGFFTPPPGPSVRQVMIQINPLSAAPAGFNIDSEGAIPVAILGRPTFDVTTIDPTSVTFGPKGAKNSRAPFFADVNRDGKPDLILYFAPSQSGVGCSDVSVALNGETFSKDPFSGTESIRTTHSFPCPRK